MMFKGQRECEAAGRAGAVLARILYVYSSSQPPHGTLENYSKTYDFHKLFFSSEA